MPDRSFMLTQSHGRATFTSLKARVPRILPVDLRPSTCAQSQCRLRLEVWQKITRQTSLSSGAALPV